MARTERPTELTCDCCKTTYTDVMEIQEFLTFSDTGGYRSVIGDMVKWSINMCQHCVVLRLGMWIRTDKSGGWIDGD